LADDNIYNTKAVQLVAAGTPVPDRRRDQLRELLAGDPDILAQLLVRGLGNCSEDAKATIRRMVGCGCDGSPKLDADYLRKMVRDMVCCDPNRRLSRMEEEDLRTNDGADIDLPTVQGGASATVNVPAYNTGWYFRQFSVDGRVPDTGSLAKVRITLIHANRPLISFRVSQYYKESCCTTLADEYNRYRRCFGWASTFQIRIENLNANPQDQFTNGVFQWVRGFPADWTDLEIMGERKSCP